MQELVLATKSPRSQSPMPLPLGSSREAILILLAVLVTGMLFQRRSLSRRLEILEADLALYALRKDVLHICVSALCMERHIFLKGGKCGAFVKAKKTYRFELRLGHVSGIFGVALAL
jgi:hypothetical protein